MSQMIFWMLGVSFGAGAILFSVALNSHPTQFALSAIIALCIVVSAVRDFFAQQSGEHPSRRAAVLVRHMGMLWAWAAVSITLIYGFLLQWDEWHSVFVVTVLGAALCLFMANVLERDAEEDAKDARMISFVGLIAKIQFGATCVAIGGLVAFGKLSTDAFGGEAKWAAVNILLCMGLALAGLSGFTMAQGSMEERPVEKAAPVAAAPPARKTAPRVAPSRAAVARAAPPSRPTATVRATRTRAPRIAT